MDSVIGRSKQTTLATEQSMSPKSLRIALLGSYVPRKCGIATFTEDVFKCLNRLESISDVDVYAMDDGNSLAYPPEVVSQIDQSPASYHAAALKISTGNYDALFIQHEFGLFGGNSGDNLFELLDRTSVPVVTMMHTVLKTPNEDQRRVVLRLNLLSEKFVTMSERGRHFLTSIYGVPAHKIEVVPHGIPDTPQRQLETNKAKFGLSGHFVALTFGLIGPGKGLEYAIDAMPEIVRKHPQFKYVLLGATHPNLLKEEGEKYRDELIAQAKRLGVINHLHFENRFVELDELTQWIGAADVYLTPYLNEAQITSGTLSYAYGCGTPIVSTPYWHAVDLLADNRGCLVPFRDSHSIACEVNRLLSDNSGRERMASDAYRHGRTMVWPFIANRLADILRESMVPHRNNALAKDSKSGSHGKPPYKSMDLRHLFRLTDVTGIVQHATCALPNRHEGYCVDDNARALLLTLILDQLGCEEPQLFEAQCRYAEFVNHAIDDKTGKVINFMSYSRQWLEHVGANDSIARTSWVLGACVRQSSQQGMRLWAKRMYEPVLRQVAETNSLRAWCFGLLGVCDFRQHDPDNEKVNAIGRELLSKIAFRRKESCSENWVWFEDRLTYDNAKLPHALLVGAASFEVPALIDDALASLSWLTQVQSGPGGCFSPIGSDDFHVRGECRSVFDQQPLEAWATTSACLAAYEHTRSQRWFDEARRAYEWFLGRNVRNWSMIDVSTGGCFDGLHCDRLNYNQGAESTLAWLLADAEMRLASNQFS